MPKMSKVPKMPKINAFYLWVKVQGSGFKAFKSEIRNLKSAIRERPQVALPPYTGSDHLRTS